MWLIVQLDWALPIKIQAPIGYLVYHTVPTQKGAPSPFPFLTRHTTSAKVTATIRKYYNPR